MGAHSTERGVDTKDRLFLNTPSAHDNLTPVNNRDRLGTIHTSKNEGGFRNLNNFSKTSNTSRVWNRKNKIMTSYSLIRDRNQ